jgi:UDP-N-acetylmuramate-alanine ligase
VASEAADRARGGRVWWLPTAEQAAQAIGPRLREGDLLITIGAGDIHKLAETLVDGADR